jgi:hypothetical protein
MKLFAIFIFVLEIAQLSQATNIVTRLPPAEILRLGGQKKAQETGDEWEQFKTKNSKFSIFFN